MQTPFSPATSCCHCPHRNQSRRHVFGVIAILPLIAFLSTSARAASQTTASAAGDPQLTYGWSVSHSATDPDVNTGSPNGSIVTCPTPREDGPLQSRMKDVELSILQ
jgi:hypothetical protein